MPSQNYTGINYTQHNFIDPKTMKPMLVGETILSMRNKLYDELAETLLKGIVDGSVTDELSKNISTFILGNLDTVTSKDDMVHFLYNLSTKWAAYNPFYVKLKYQEHEEREQKKIQEIQDKLQKFMKHTYGSDRT